MIRTLLKGHDNYYGISDVLRLFFDGVREDREHCSVICNSEKDVDILIESCVADGTVSASCGDHCVSVTEGEIPVKREVKRTLYSLLVKLTGHSFPWGCLTGIRPTLVASECGSPDRMTDMYYVRPDKAELAVRTLGEEIRLLDKIPDDSLNIYIGVPFCPTRCEYCSFVSADISHHMGLLRDYEDALISEITSIGQRLTKKIANVYMGGGTPTVFDDKAMDRILKCISSSLPIDSDTEFTVEAGRPDTITLNKLVSMKQAGVNRICINPQTMNDRTLELLNRRHTAEDTVRAYGMAKEVGLDLINMDLIAGLKYEEADMLLHSLEKVMKLDPANITIHTLYKKRRAAMSRGDVLDRDESRGDIDKALTKAYGILDQAGYAPYYMYRQKDTGHGLENVGFAKDGTGCLYNVAMMSDRRDVLALGAGGMSKRCFEGGRLERCSGTKDIIGYIRGVNELIDKKTAFFDINGIQ